MTREKTNPYTGRSYECECDYSYTCKACTEVRNQWQQRKQAQESMAWTIASIQALAKAVGVPLPPAPVFDEDNEP